MTPPDKSALPRETNPARVPGEPRRFSNRRNITVTRRAVPAVLTKGGEAALVLTPPLPPPSKTFRSLEGHTDDAGLTLIKHWLKPVNSTRGRKKKPGDVVEVYSESDGESRGLCLASGHSRRSSARETDSQSPGLALR